MAAGKYLYAVGRRKLATAVVKLYPQGSGQMIVKKGTSGVTLAEYFGGHGYLIENSLFPFVVIGDGAEKKFDAEIVLR